jgi:hypothetical protein
MSDHRDRDPLDEFRDDFAHRIAQDGGSSAHSWRTRALAVVAGLGVLAGSGVALATVVDNPTPGDPPTAQDNALVGYVNLGTGELIRCPDGEPLAKRAGAEGPPTCANGAIPEAYTAQLAEFERWADEHAEFGRPVEDGPVFAVVLDE